MGTSVRIHTVSTLIFVAAACALAVVAPAAAQSSPSDAAFRYHLLADLGGDPAVGCSMQRGALRWEGLEARWEVHADRSHVRHVSRYRCTAGGWERHSSTDGGERIRLQTSGGGDRLGWHIERSALAADGNAILHVFAEDPLSGALDVAGGAGGWVLAPAALSVDSAVAIPLLGPVGKSVLLVLMLLAAGWTLRANKRSLRPIPGSLRAFSVMCCLAGALLGSSTTQADRLDEKAKVWQAAALTHLDAARDLLGNESAVDLLRLELTGDSEAIRIDLTVYDVEVQALAATSRVLFVGSNLTSSNDLPGLFAAMAAQRGKSVQVASITFNGASLEDHFIKGEVLRELQTGSYDMVVMQQGPSTLPENQQHLRDWSARMAEAARAGGARPALLMVWPDASRTAFFNGVSSSYREAAIAVDGWLLPAGEAWRAAWREDPLLDLYANDLNNPSPLGSYAAAATLFAGLYRESPEGLPASLQVAGGTLKVGAAEAAIAQRAAWQAHLRHGLTGR